jgi:hypothetical protein
MHLLYSLAVGLEQIHKAHEYHGDLHDGNVLVERLGIGFEVRLVDFYHWGPATRPRMQDDVIDAIRLLYDAVGGAPWYPKQPPEIKAICRGLRRDLISRQFPTARHLREYLETFIWSEP